MIRQEKLFLTKNTLPLFDRLLDLLDTIPGELLGRTASQFFYAGLATRYEDERLTEEDRDTLPERINELRSGKFGTWLSEREWIPVTLETASRPRRLVPNWMSTRATLIASKPCPVRKPSPSASLSIRRAIVQSRLWTSCAGVMVNPQNRRIYMMSRDVEGRWLDLHQRETGRANRSIDGSPDARLIVIAPVTAAAPPAAVASVDLQSARSRPDRHGSCSACYASRITSPYSRHSSIGAPP